MYAEPLAPARVAALDQTRAAARDDLNDLRVAFVAITHRFDETRAVETLAQGILDDPDWDRWSLAWALTEALALLSKPTTPEEPMTNDSATAPEGDR